MTTAVVPWVWVEALHRFTVYHQPGPSRFTMCGKLMQGSGQTIRKSQAVEMRAQQCPWGCYRPRQLPTPKYREHK